MASPLSNVPEVIVQDHNAADETGCPQSKLISEWILVTAARVGDVPCAVFRVGQIASPTTAACSWSSQTWPPGLIKSSKFLKGLSDSIGTVDFVDWVPVNLIASMFLDFALLT